MEKQRKEKKSTGGNGDIFDSVPPLPENKNVNVSSGPYAEELPIAGSTVGEVRRRFSDRFDIDDKSTATVNGNAANDDVILKSGEALMFVRHAGEKGGGAGIVTLEGDTATAELNVSPARMKIADLIKRASRVQTSTNVLPQGVRAVLTQGEQTLMFWERPPHIARLSWIAKDSPQPYGPGTKYRWVRISLPYLIIVATFTRDGGDNPELNTLANECFFRNEPMRSMEDELSYPALLNCSVIKGSDSPLSWICTQYLKHKHVQEDKYSNGLESVRYCLLETSFNLSSEHNEGNSWFGASKKKIPQVETVEKWEAETVKDPLFATTVPWLPTGHTIQSFADRTFKRLGAATGGVETADDLARIIING